MPDETEAAGLLALMLLHDSRREARIDERGEIVLLDDQDRTPVGRRGDRRGPQAWSSARCAPGRPAPTCCRRRSPPSTPRRRRRRTPTGRRSRACTTSSTGACRRRWSRSTGRPPSRWRTALRGASSSSTTSPGEARWTATTCCTRPGPTCCAGWGAPTRRRRRTQRALALATNPVERAFLRRRLDESRRSSATGWRPSPAPRGRLRADRRGCYHRARQPTGGAGS